MGKGKGNRALSHIDGKGDTPHDQIIRELHKKRLEPRVEILIHGLETEREALNVEMAAISLLGVDQLANRVEGHRRHRNGRMSLDQARALYSTKQVEIVEPSILIRVARAYQYGMPAVALYDATRSAWKTGPRRDRAKYAFSVFEGVVREVYRITAWLPSGTTFKTGRHQGDLRIDRWEFVGVVAEDTLRKKYLDRSVAHYFKKSSQNPILYVGCERG
ncbi:hypothetical protein [Mucisphaera calidilacus]|uniref:hypothetical protein n=1 Tax=Mucisphaera calidilacus TaxID=2527982 RepID=UPI0011A38ACD|nr:hypothetical protein [Mucisphaera calidilacus]